MANQKQSFKVAKANIWIIGGKEFTSKNAAYRLCRTMNRKKAGGTRNHTVERKNA